MRQIDITHLQANSMRWTQIYLGSIPVQKAKPKPNNTEISDKTRLKDDLQNNQTEFF